MMNGMPITMLNGFGCAECGGSCNSLRGLGVTRAEVEEFFIGKNKYVKSTKPTPIFKNPGEASYKTISANDTIGKVIALNEKANWGKLESGDWISLSPTSISSFYTVILSVAPPKSVADAVGREVDNIPFLPSAATLKLVLWAVIAVGVTVVILRFSPPKKLSSST